MEIENHKFIKLIEENISPLNEIAEKPWGVEENIAYIEDDEIKKLFKSAMAKIKSISDTVEEKADKYTIRYWINGRKFCEIGPKKKYIVIGFKTDETESKWDYITNISTMEQLDEIFNDKVIKGFNLMKK